MVHYYTAYDWNMDQNEVPQLLEGTLKWVLFIVERYSERGEQLPIGNYADSMFRVKMSGTNLIEEEIAGCFPLSTDYGVQGHYFLFSHDAINFYILHDRYSYKSKARMFEGSLNRKAKYLLYPDDEKYIEREAVIDVLYVEVDARDLNLEIIMKEIHERKIAPPIKSARMAEQKNEKIATTNLVKSSSKKKKKCLLM